MAANVATNPSIFLRLKQSDPQPREIAWVEFHGRYAAVIAAFAQRLGARHHDVEDVVQDVLTGFFSKAPTFVYDPNKGRFRGYLKTCTYRALRDHLQKKAHLKGIALDQINPDALAIDQVWNDVWERELLARALEQLRNRLGKTKRFQAFEKYVGLNEPAQTVADSLGVHITTVYHAKEKITQLLRETVCELDDED